MSNHQFSALMEVMLLVFHKYYGQVKQAKAQSRGNKLIVASAGTDKLHFSVTDKFVHHW